MNSQKNIQKQYIGYQRTPLLSEDLLDGLTQFHCTTHNESKFNQPISKSYRLGHLVEFFVEQEFKEQVDINILGRNIQVNSDKETIGEFDFIVEQNNLDYHIEVVYKFYLYDQTVGKTEIEHWIGPNRKDSLIEKLNKIKSKQFPLIHNPQAKDILSNLGINPVNTLQKLYFKAQLFIPFETEANLYPNLKQNIYGFFILKNRMVQFETYKFFHPTKLDWLVEPHTDVNWLNYNQVNALLNEISTKKRSLLLWLKGPKGNLTKVFVVDDEWYSE